MQVHRLWAGTALLLAVMAASMVDRGLWLGAPLVLGIVLVVCSFPEEGTQS